MFHTKKGNTGFTIVELLIVIVVIAILAAISIVAYNGIQKRAQASAASSALNQASKKIVLAQVDSNAASPTCAEFYTILTTRSDLTGPEACTFNFNSIEYQYKQTPASSPYTGYCITATSGSTSYNITNSGASTNGGCSGHSQNGNIAITNLHTNPSVEGTTIAGFNGPNSSTVTQSSARAYSGSKSVLVTLPTAANGGTTGVHTTAGYSIGTQLKASTAYTYSIWVYIPSSTVNMYVSSQGSTTASTCNSATVTAVKDTWVRLSCSITTAASGNVVIYVLSSTAPTAGMIFYVDSVMITAGNSLYPYADGYTDNWDWNGTANSASSTGPAL